MKCKNLDYDCASCKLAELGATNCAHSMKHDRKTPKYAENNVEENDISISERLTEDEDKLNITILFIVGVAIVVATIGISLIFAG